eukprot:16301587-Heterocapsa_arctica.AAC.1
MDSMCPGQRSTTLPAPAARSPTKTAGKGAMGAGKAAVNPNFYAGYCYNCGKWGHRSTTCRVAVAASFDEVLDDNP